MASASSSSSSSSAILSPPNPTSFSLSSISKPHASSPSSSSSSTAATPLCSLPKPFSQTLTLTLSSNFNTFLSPRSLSSRRSPSSNRTFVVRASAEQVPLVGNVAPDFEAEAVFDHEFVNVKLSDYKGKKYVILFFYPLDFTFVCPIEITAFCNRHGEFEKLNTEIIGVSIDSVASISLSLPPSKPPSNLSFPSKPCNFLPKQCKAPSTSPPPPPPKPPRNHPQNPTTSLPSPLTNLPISPLSPPNPPQSTLLNPSKPSPPPHHHLSSTTTPQDFHEKALFLDSFGLDSLSNLPPSAIANTPNLNDLKSTFSYLTSLGFTPPQLRRIITMCPDILSLRLRDIAPVFAFLLREASVRAEDLPHVISRRPRLLLSNVETRLRPTMYFLQSIGIHEVHRHTNLLSASVEDKYIPKIDFFQKVGFSYHDSISLFRKFPTLFCYSVKDNFEPKFNYFVVEMGRDLKELKGFPQYFSFSLEKRIKTRHQRCVESGVYFPLPVMLKMKEDDFRKRLDVCCNSSMPKSDSPLWVS